MHGRSVFAGLTSAAVLLTTVLVPASPSSAEEGGVYCMVTEGYADFSTSPRLQTPSIEPSEVLETTLGQSYFVDVSVDGCDGEVIALLSMVLEDPNGPYYSEEDRLPITCAAITDPLLDSDDEKLRCSGTAYPNSTDGSYQVSVRAEIQALPSGNLFRLDGICPKEVDRGQCDLTVTAVGSVSGAYVSTDPMCSVTSADFETVTTSSRYSIRAHVTGCLQLGQADPIVQPKIVGVAIMDAEQNIALPCRTNGYSGSDNVSCGGDTVSPIPYNLGVQVEAIVNIPEYGISGRLHGYCQSSLNLDCPLSVAMLVGTATQTAPFGSVNEHDASIGASRSREVAIDQIVAKHGTNLLDVSEEAGGLTAKVLGASASGEIAGNPESPVAVRVVPSDVSSGELEELRTSIDEELRADGAYAVTFVDAQSAQVIAMTDDAAYPPVRRDALIASVESDFKTQIDYQARLHGTAQLIDRRLSAGVTGSYSESGSASAKAHNRDERSNLPPRSGRWAFVYYPDEIATSATYAEACTLGFIVKNPSVYGRYYTTVASHCTKNATGTNVHTLKARESDNYPVPGQLIGQTNKTGRYRGVDVASVQLPDGAIRWSGLTDREPKRLVSADPSGISREVSTNRYAGLLHGPIDGYTDN